MEIPLCPYDSCRLLSVILPTFVDKPFTKEASFDFVRFKRVAYIAQRLMDDIVDLEEEKIDAILAKIKQDNEPDDIKDREMKLWFKIKEKLLQGRRTGLSAIGLADVAAMLNIRYDDCADIAEEIYKTLALASYESSIDMAEERGAFPIQDLNLDLNSPYINRILAELSPEINDKFINNGRRNIANLTIPPSGTLSLMSKINQFAGPGITSGIEPVFMPIHKRRRKVNPDHPNKSFQDKNGDWWEEYNVIHEGFKQWFIIASGCEHCPEVALDRLNKADKYAIQEILEHSPYYKSSAMEIDPLKKIKMLGRVQKWIDHAISQTTNLPATATIHDVENIYIEAWKNGLKGITVYRDGCRNGVLISADEKKKEEFKQHDAPKRPKSLTCDVRKIIVKGKEWVVCIGLYEQKPYEVFAFENKWDMFKKDNQYKGFINKVAGGDYDLYIPGIATFENITDEMTQGEEDRTRMISTSLRHGANVKFIIEQLNKSKNIDITSFSKAIARALKYYIKDGEVAGESCPLCGGKIIYKDGCKECADCGEYSKCG